MRRHVFPRSCPVPSSWLSTRLLPLVTASALPLMAQATPQRQPAPDPAQPATPPAQDPGTSTQTPSRETEPVVVTASRTAQDPFRSPYTVDIVTSEQVGRRSYRTLPQALREVPGVLVQETAPGQGSPFVRGFTGYLNLLLIDGVRLNNSVFRSGPNQYWNTVDLLGIERIEVVKGPTSSLYGSDAVGGTVQVFTRDPYTYGDRSFAVGGSSYLRYATGEDSLWGRAELSAGYAGADGSKTGFLLGGDARSLGDIEGGHDTGNQPYTGYDETAYDFKVEHWLDKDTRLVFLHQQLVQDDVPRTHATVFAKSFRGSAVGTDTQRELDQRRSLTYLQLHKTNMGGPVQRMHWNVSWQEQDEVEERTPSNNNPQAQGFQVGTLGLFAQFDSDLGQFGTLTWGADWYHDNVNSFFRRRNNPQPADSIQGPVANDARYDLVGVFVQDVVALADGVELTLGARYNYARADADAVRADSSNNAAQIAVKDSWDQFTANARLRVDLVPQDWNVFGGLSQGFRAPNLSDLSSFDTARSGELEVPAPGLQPEQYTSYEVGTKVAVGDVAAQAAWYYTDIEDQILRFPTGQTSPSNQPIVTKANVGNGYVQGVEIGASWRCTTGTTLFGATTWQYGRVTNYNAGGTQIQDDYISRLMPLTTMAGVRYEDPEGRFWAETLVLRAEDADKLSAADQRDTQRIPPGGTPSYTVWNARVGYQLSEQAAIDAGIDNITDVDYRTHGSGSNSLGRNFVVGMRVRF